VELLIAVGGVLADSNPADEDSTRGKRISFEPALDTPTEGTPCGWLAMDDSVVALDQAPLSSRFSEVAFPEVRSGCNGRFRFPAREQTAASRARLASHFALRGGARDRVARRSMRLDPFPAWRLSGQLRERDGSALVGWRSLGLDRFPE